MNLLKGTIPERSAWRAMVLFAPGEEPDAAWALGRALARAHGGEVLAVVLCSDVAAVTYKKAEKTLAGALELCDQEEVVLPFIIAADNFQATLRTFTVKADVDVLLAHAPEPEKEMVAEGFAVNRRIVMHNDFLIAGPEGDPAGIRGSRHARRPGPLRERTDKGTLHFGRSAGRRGSGARPGRAPLALPAHPRTHGGRPRYRSGAVLSDTPYPGC